MWQDRRFIPSTHIRVSVYTSHTHTTIYTTYPYILPHIHVSVYTPLTHTTNIYTHTNTYPYTLPPHSCECIHIAHTYYKYVLQCIHIHTPTHILTHSPYLHTHSCECTHIPHTYYKHILHVHTHTPAYILTHSPHRHTSTTPHHTISRTRLSSSCQNDLLLGSWKDCVWWDGIGWNGPGSPRILFIKMKARHMDQIRAQ